MNFEYDLARTGGGLRRIDYRHFILTLECCRSHFFHRPLMSAPRGLVCSATLRFA
jgi:hypothetical protein